MSYSFSLKAASKAAAKEAVAAKFDEVVSGQSVHETDRGQAVAAAEAFIDLLADPEDGEEVILSVSGSLSWSGQEPRRFYSANVSISAGIAKAVT